MRIDQDVRRDIEEAINGLVWDWSKDISSRLGRW